MLYVAWFITEISAPVSISIVRFRPEHTALLCNRWHRHCVEIIDTENIVFLILLLFCHLHLIYSYVVSSLLATLTLVLAVALFCHAHSFQMPNFTVDIAICNLVCSHLNCESQTGISCSFVCLKHFHFLVCFDRGCCINCCSC